MSKNDDILVSVEHLKKYFPVKGVKGPGVQAVEDISMYIKRGETLVSPGVGKRRWAGRFCSCIRRRQERSLMTAKSFMRARTHGKRGRMAL